MNDDAKTNLILGILVVSFLGLGAAFLGDVWGHSEPLPAIPLVDESATNTATFRVSAKELIQTGGDASGLDCYACHDRNKRSEVTFNEQHTIVLPEEHNDIPTEHGRHNRNNHCYNCHDEVNLELLQTRDGRQLKLTESTALCGSCHGPSYRDWEGGAHGRTSGFWRPSDGNRTRQDCVACHDPHSPRIKPYKPTPGPRPLRPAAVRGPNQPSTAAEPH